MNKKTQEKTKTTGILYNSVIVLLILIIAISSCIGTFAWAKYTSAINGTTTAQIAKWSFKLVDGVTETTDVIDFAFTRTDGYGKVVEGRLAPGTFGEFEIGIDARGTETILEYIINVELENKPTYLKFYRDVDKTEEILVTDNKLTIEGFMSLEDVEEIRTETIYWDWPYENGDDAQDTQDAGKLVTMQVSVTGYEVLGPEIEETEWVFDYSGQVEEFIVPVTGTYQLEVWGAQGGAYGNSYRKGGYSVGNVKLTESSVIYIVVGGRGLDSSSTSRAGGYNGGGNGARSASGGGATHIGTFNSTLKEHGSTEGLYIVAGGAGGSANYGSSYSAGGAGGGLTGGDGTNQNATSINIGTNGSGGTQTGAGTSGVKGTFGAGGNGKGGSSSGGGGGRRWRIIRWKWWFSFWWSAWCWWWRFRLHWRCN